MSTVNIKEIQQKLYEKLKASGWGDPLKAFILSSDFEKILNFLLKESLNGRKFTPVLKQLFTAFEECPYDKVQVVMLGMDPYPYLGTADGIAFSCSNTMKPAASLQFIQKEIVDTVYKDNRTMNPDLRYLSNQGVLLLNTALTTEIDKVGVHIELWRPFISYLLDMLAFKKAQLLYVFMGSKARGWNKSIPDQNYKFFVTHPASAAHDNAERWDSGNLFNNINTVLKKNFNTEIQW
jgi:uracil-DNA glycosylase